jgi:hypothetical protein
MKATVKIRTDHAYKVRPRHCRNSFALLIHLISPTTQCKDRIMILFYRGGNEASERASNLLKITQLQSGGIRIQTWVGT